MDISPPAKELAERGRHIINTYGIPSDNPFGPDLEWSADGVRIYLDTGREWRFVIRATALFEGRLTRIYSEGNRPNDQFCTPDVEIIERALAVLRRHMVLDDLANL